MPTGVRPRGPCLRRLQHPPQLRGEHQHCHYRCHFRRFRHVILRRPTSGCGCGHRPNGLVPGPTPGPEPLLRLVPGASRRWTDESRRSSGAPLQPPLVHQQPLVPPVPARQPLHVTV